MILSRWITVITALFSIRLWKRFPPLAITTRRSLFSCRFDSGLSGTTWGGDQDIAGSAIQKALADYPQAIVMTAHSHYSNEAENGIYQGDFTVVNNGSMDYVELPSSLEPVLPHAQGKFEDGTLVEYERTCSFISVLEDGNTVIRRYDATNQRWMGMPWIIGTAQGKEGFRYTDEKRSEIAPWFEEDADISVSNVTETAADFTFTQAVDDELTEHYEIGVREVLGNKAATYTVEPEYFGNNEAKTYTGSFTVYSRFYRETVSGGDEAVLHRSLSGHCLSHHGNSRG